MISWHSLAVILLLLAIACFSHEDNKSSKSKVKSIEAAAKLDPAKVTDKSIEAAAKLDPAAVVIADETIEDVVLVKTAGGDDGGDNEDENEEDGGGENEGEGRSGDKTGGSRTGLRGVKNASKVNKTKPIKVISDKEFDPIVELPRNKTMRIAFCLTGQLARLELASKIKNIFMVNAQLGHTVDLFVLLDDNIKDIHQTFWNYDYSSNLFALYNASKLEQLIAHKAKGQPWAKNFKFYVRLEKPGQPYFQVVGGMIPVETKKIVNVEYEREHGLLGAGDGIEPASQRFQNNMRWLGGLRDCVKWTMQREYEERKFYDIVVRLRDDTLAFGKWKFFQERYLGALTSARVGSFRGVNDHNFVIDRRWGDTLFRGLTEDYYFNATFEKVMWGNPEHRIEMMARALNVPILNTTICEEPLIPLRGRHNDTHWLLHASYRDNLLAECNNRKQRRINKCICPPSWLRILHHGTIPFDLKNSEH